MNVIAPVVDRLHDPAQLLAALPYLLGFHPRDSLVLVTVEPGAPPTVGLVLRADLPPRGLEHQLAEQIQVPVRLRGVSAVILAMVGGRAQPPPAALDAVRDAMAGIGVQVLHELWAESTAAGARWACLRLRCHQGRLPDSTASPLAAATAAAGMVTHADREGVHRLVEPDGDAALQRRAVLLDTAVEAAELDRQLAGEPAVRRDLAVVRGAVHEAAAGRLPAGDEEVVRLAVALSDRRVRDLALGFCLGEHSAAAERLWLALTRATPPPEVAEPAALAALSAYLRGEGALAGMALERALQAWPGHVLATLADQALRTAVPPWRLRSLLLDACADAELDLADPGDHGDAALAG
jgi:hypothetical protein